MEVKGYKVFNPNWTCKPDWKPYQYRVGKTFTEDVELSVCNRGFHFCKKAEDCFDYYKFDPKNKVAEVVALGEIKEKDNKCCTNKIQILREIAWGEVLTLVNTGKGCTGISNSGRNNSGNWNSGDSNTGSDNSGNRNTGDNNSGDWNGGDYNSGNWNIGDSNIGNNNSGSRNGGSNNSGNFNNGNDNSGSGNRGNRNRGHYNSGDINNGDSNNGDFNRGYNNNGHYNNGDCNIGSYNAGSWNYASQSTGCFNTQSQKLRFFDKETDMTFAEWEGSRAKYLLNQIKSKPTEWIFSHKMTDAEKTEHPKHRTTGGYLKIHNNTKPATRWWNDLSEDDKNIIKTIPNFNLKKFKEITGIEI